MGKYIIDNASECFTKVFGKQWIDKKMNGILMNWVDVCSLPHYFRIVKISVIISKLLLTTFISVFEIII